MTQRLHSFGGGSAPDGLGMDLRTLAVLPDAVREDFWSLLEPNLAPKVGPEADAAALAFCRKHEISMDELVRPVRAARLLLRSAAQLDVAPADLAADVGLLCEGDAETKRIVGACYGQALMKIRLEMVLVSMSEFGAVLDDVAIRIDCVALTRHAQTQLPVSILTLRYKEEGEERRVTLHLSPGAVAKLKRALDSSPSR